MIKKILIACEYSGRVREAFTRLGYDATSCDFLPTEIPGKHYQGNVFDIISIEDWALMIAFPPCTHLTSAGAVYWPEKQKNGSQENAINFVKNLYYSHIDKIAIENPVGILSSVWQKPNQILHPYNFGEPYKKRTCLWLKNLPILRHTNNVEPLAHWHSGSVRGGKKRDGTRTPSALPALHANSKKRSLTFQGIANAMALQWSEFL